jgi:hypothetical protein
MLVSKQRCHPDRSEAEWRDLLFIIRSSESEWKRYAPLCHPDRSVAKWRDLQFRGPLLEMFFRCAVAEFGLDKPAKRTLGLSSLLFGKLLGT